MHLPIVISLRIYVCVCKLCCKLDRGWRVWNASLHLVPHLQCSMVHISARSFQLKRLTEPLEGWVCQKAVITTKVLFNQDSPICQRPIKSPRRAEAEDHSSHIIFGSYLKWYELGNCGNNICRWLFWMHSPLFVASFRRKGALFGDKWMIE